MGYFKEMRDNMDREALRAISTPLLFSAVAIGYCALMYAIVR